MSVANGQDGESRSKVLAPGPSIRMSVILCRLALLGTATAGVAALHGFPKPLIEPMIDRGAQVLLFAAFVIDIWLGRRFGRIAIADRPPRARRQGVVHAFAGLCAIAGALGSDIAWRGFEVIVVLLLLMVFWQLHVALSRRLARPGILLPASFAVLIVIATALLKLPLASTPGRELSWLDALFTMTSAVCVTGLTVRDTSADFSPFGQILIGLFMQLGGLGIVTFGSMLAVLLRSRISLREDINLSDALNEQPVSRLRSLILFILGSTVVCELISAAAMYPMWHGELSTSRRIGMSLFHAVSAFNNAGFDLTGASLEPYRYSALAHGVILPLIVLGGLGYPVLENLFRMARCRVWPSCRRDAPLLDRRMTLHTKIVLTTTAGLYLFGVMVIASAQLMPIVTDYFQLNVTANRPAPMELDLPAVGGVLADASFMSVTARTAGFNTMPMDQVRPAGQLGLMTLMMIGGSPGGTAGGMRTTTFALLLLSIIATVRRRPHLEAFGRYIDDVLVRKAAVMAACFIGLVTAATLLLCMVEPFALNKLLFEVISAVTVTGLSLGITAELTAFGKVVIIVSMFLGRVGPLALLAALAFGTSPKRRYYYAREDVMVG
jgi:trk system potassium uptake protein TrkH